MGNISFNQVSIVEQLSYELSRSNVNIGVDMGKFFMELPVISANMPQITGTSMAVCMYENGGRGILHRDCSIDENVDMYLDAVAQTEMQDSYSMGVSIGVQKRDLDRFIRLYQAGARLFCIDVAHGHHILVKQMIETIKGGINEDGSRYEGINIDGRTADVYLIAGNVARAEGARDLAEWGADAIKVGIGPGSCCATRKNTGVGTPQFTAIQNAKEGLKDYPNVKIIADGGIKNAGDIPKALAAGADVVMLGAVLAGTTETPGKVFPCPETDLWDRRYYKVFGGSASGENKVSGGKEHKFVEGIMKTVPFKGKAKYILNEIVEGLQSCFSYTGAKDMETFKRKVKYEIMESSGISESKL